MGWFPCSGHSRHASRKMRKKNQSLDPIEPISGFACFDSFLYLKLRVCSTLLNFDGSFLCGFLASLLIFFSYKKSKIK